MHVGTHGLCVRPNNRAFVFHSPSADARTVRPYMLVAGTMDCQGVDTVGRNEGQGRERQVFWHQFTVSVPYGPVVCAR